MSRTAQKVSQVAAKNYSIGIQQSTDGSAVGSAAGASVQVSVPAGGLIAGIMWSYSGPVTTGGMNISDSSGTLGGMDIHSGSGQNFGYETFNPPIQSQISNSAITVTLTGGTSGGSASITNTTAKLSLIPSWQEA